MTSSYKRKFARCALMGLLFVISVHLFAGCAQERLEVGWQRVPGGDEARGEELIPAYGCPACHTIPGIVTADGQVGPPLADWADREFIAGSLVNSPANLVLWIREPQSVEPGTAMPDMGVTEADARDIAAYLYTLGAQPDPVRQVIAGEAGQEMAGDKIEQPIPFNHQIHASGLGIDCRYCHTSVERSPFAGMPSTQTCMSCHSQILTDLPLLEPVRTSWELDAPIPWVRVYDLPEFVTLNHASHVNNGVGCDECHGEVDEMAIVEQATPLTMAWCLDCHRRPEQYVRPREEIFNLDWEPPANQIEMGRGLIEEYEIPKEILTDCSLCHY